MNSFSCFVLYLVLTFQAECKRHRKTGDVEQFRRLYSQTKFPSSLPQQLASLDKLTTKSRFGLGNIKIKVKDSLKADEDTRVIKRESKVQNNTKEPLEPLQTLRKEKIRQDLQNAIKKPKVLEDKKKKAIRERYYQKERDDVMAMERQRVRELKQEVQRLRTVEPRHNQQKHQAKSMNHKNGHNMLNPLMRSNQGYHKGKKAAQHMRKQMKSIITERATPTSGTSSSSRKVKKFPGSSASNEGPVMRGMQVDFEDDDDEELNFDIDGEQLSQIVMRRDN